MISVIICTYNRADLLAGALESVCQQSLAASAYEIVVVDNNSTDETPQVSRAYAERYPDVRYYIEPQQGLSYARNRDWQEARGEYVAYIDDDCQAPASWLAVGQAVIEHVAPDGFGGPILLFIKRQSRLGSRMHMALGALLRKPPLLHLTSYTVGICSCAATYWPRLAALIQPWA